MSNEHNPMSPFANGPRENDAAEQNSTGRQLPLRVATARPSTSMTGAPAPSNAAGQATTETAKTSQASTLPATAADESAYADTFYGQVGGHETFKKMIHVFYQGIAADPLLRAMYAEEDLGPAENRMLMFIEQYWGGPRTYLEERGHPRLRMRHVPFVITPEARDRWLAAMRKGVDAVELSPMHEATLWDYMERAAASLVNAASDPAQRD